MLSLWTFSQLTLIGILQIGDALYNGPEQSSPELGEFPYMVEIYDFISVKPIACGGAIIDPTHILTAAHCLTAAIKDRLIIIAGAIDVFSESRIQQQGVAEIFIHNKYAINGILWHQTQSTKRDQIRKWFCNTFKHFNYEVNTNTLQYDIAVLKLNEALPIGDYIKPINLPSLDFPLECYLCTFAGWGQIEINGPSSTRLYATQFLVLAPQECEAMFTRLPSNEFCVIDPTGRSTPLQGDSGAPLVLDNTVYGVLSRSRGDLRFPSIFTKVSAHLKWIRKVLRK